MKKVFSAIFMAILTLAPTKGNAQDLKSVLSGILSGTTSSETVTNAKNVLGSLLGTTKVQQSKLTGTWNYSRPAIAFESSNVLNKIGGSVVSNKIENKIATILTNHGIKAGALSITFQSDSTFTSKLGTKTVSGTYKTNNANVIFTFATGRTVTANTKLSGSNLQLTFTADKLLTFIKNLNSQLEQKTSNSTLSTISTLLKSYSGMQLGLQFSKSK